MEYKNVLWPELSELCITIAEQAVKLIAAEYMKYKDKPNTIVFFTGELSFNYTVKDPEGNIEVINTECSIRS